jgi:ATP-dependent DNA helicase RecG
MPEFEVATIDAGQADALLSLEEGHLVDLKSIGIKPAKLTKCVSAFANTSGGELYVGIDEGNRAGAKVRSWRGFYDIEAANGVLQAVEELDPFGSHYSAAFLRCQEHPGLVLQLTILKSRAVVSASDGIPYIRRGAQSLPIDTDEGLYKLRLDKGIDSFEDQVVDLELAEIENSAIILKFLLDVIPNAEPKQWLSKQRLIRAEKPTVAGVLLFAEEPQSALPKRSGVKLFHYRTRSEEGDRDYLAFDPISIEGCLYDQIYAAVSKTKETIERTKLLGEKGLEKVSYPDETLHEIITNALLHRDYSIAQDVHIRIYDNRVEVQSPGRLPGHVTPANILDEQVARNPQIVRLINKFPDPPNKDVGEGLNTAFQAMKRLKLRNPEIIELDSSVLVRINHTPLASPEEAVMEYLTEHAEITNRIGRDLTGIASENSMKTIFIRLASRCLIERVPGKEGPKAAWRKIANA